MSTILESGSSLPISEGQALSLICSTDSYPPANLSWSWNNLTLCPSKLSKPGFLELFPVHLKHGGVYTCQAQHALGSQHISLSLSPQSKWLVGQRRTSRRRLAPASSWQCPHPPSEPHRGPSLQVSLSCETYNVLAKQSLTILLLLRGGVGEGRESLQETTNPELRRGAGDLDG